MIIPQKGPAEDIRVVRVRVRKKVKRKKRRSKLLYFLLFVALVLSLGGVVSGVVASQAFNATYSRAKSLSGSGIQHLHTAESLFAAYPKNFLDARPLVQAEQEFAAASEDFAQVRSIVTSLPGISASVPVFGVQVTAATHLLPIATEIAQAGTIGCETLSLVIARFHDPASGQGFTTADLSTVDQNFHQIEMIFNQIVVQVSHLQPGDLQLNPSLSKLFDAFHAQLPALQAWMNTAARALSVLPTLLGVGKPANYLVELLDSTELRPGGGFIGNYGLVTLSGGRLVSANITDTYLLDKAFVARGQSSPFPPAYTWFDLSPGEWGLRDSNLDADFPTAAGYAEQLYAREGGIISVQGVIAITPALIQHAMEVTGPIEVPEYQETVTAQNLIERIHHYQLEVTDNGVGLAPSPDGVSSYRKHFTGLLAEHFLTRVRQLPSSGISKLVPLLLNGMRTKDVQVYLNLNTAEDFLRQQQFDGSIQSPSGDGLFVVDANISPNKANSLILNTISDQVVIDDRGDAVHRTVLNYAWTLRGKYYGSSLYRDYVRVYVPPGSTLRAQSGWQPRGTSAAFGREVWAGLFELYPGQTGTISLEWLVPGAAKRNAAGGWHYQYLILKQAGIVWRLGLSVTLPSCATIRTMRGGLVSTNRQGASLNHPLDQDLTPGIDYAC